MDDISTKINLVEVEHINYLFFEGAFVSFANCPSFDDEVILRPKRIGRGPRGCALVTER
jgi:hypothetical protein